MNANALYLFILGCCASATASAQQPVAPGQMFRGGLLNVRAPNSQGWLLAQASGAGMAFARSGASAGESYVANVMLFPDPQAQGPDEFVAAIRRGMEAEVPPDRYTVRSTDLKYTDERGYPCVRVVAVAEDRHAQISAATYATLLLQLHSLYCRHPKRVGTGFMVGYSHRGATLDEMQEIAAKDFIDGVQVPTVAGEL